MICYSVAMYDFSAFDSKRLKAFTFLYRHNILLLFLGIFLLLAGTRVSFLFVLGSITVVVSGYLALFGSAAIPGNVFAKSNHLARPFLKRSSNYLFLYEEYKHVKQSALFKGGEVVWGLPVGGGEYGMMFLKNGDVVAWARLSKNFPHLVVDARQNKRAFGNNMQRKKLPVMQLQLEGSFPSYFKVYAERNQQVLALQVLSPDRMAVLIDKFGQFDFEIKDNYLKLYAVNAQKDAASMKNLVATLETWAHDLKIERIDRMKNT